MATKKKPTTNGKSPKKTASKGKPKASPKKPATQNKQED